MKAAIETAAPLIPPRPTLRKLQTVAAECQACHLWKLGTQTVFGEGKASSLIMLIGEQPGDREDLEGRPFVGPAGALLDQALEAAGIDRAKVYVTNVVKPSSGNRAGSGASIRSRMGRRSRPAAPGWSRRFG